jgi:hypothetical protein
MALKSGLVLCYIALHQLSFRGQLRCRRTMRPCGRVIRILGKLLGLWSEGVWLLLLRRQRSPHLAEHRALFPGLLRVDSIHSHSGRLHSLLGR